MRGAAVLCLLSVGAALLTGCGSSAGDGELAVGAAGPPNGRAPHQAVPPGGKVSLAPLPGTTSHPPVPGATSPPNSGAAPPATDPSPGSEPTGTPDGRDGTGTEGGHSDGGGPSGGDTGAPTPSAPVPGTSGGPGTPSRPPGGTPSPGGTRPPSTTPPTGPAVLSWDDPERAATDQRWCERVTVTFRNTGGRPVRSGEVTFGTHIIGGLGIDWGTVESTAELPAPIEAGGKREKTFPICVDAWRVPLGMHIETRDLSAEWR
ncbi:hypothetical protein ACZ90_05150 [Streptomyces albus subsp. albus]|nr:hypothetical protein ACZ90_05150 [Streptomyces albus subsp. albus]